MQQARRRSAPWRVAVLLALAVAAYAALTVTPAVAGNHGLGESACEPTIFDGLNGLESVAASARGDVAREPALNQIVQELPANAKGKGGRSFRATIPVYFHVVHAGGVGNISDKVIAEQMRVLNAAFAGFYGGAATGFSFELESYEDRQREWPLAGPTTSGERAMKRPFARAG